LPPGGKVRPEHEKRAKAAVLSVNGEEQAPMDVTQWLNPLAALLVLGGTLGAALLRCGWRDTREAARAALQLAQRPFASDDVRAELGAQIQEICEDGLVRAEPHRFGDGEFDAVADALIRRRSLAGLHEEHDKHRARRLARAESAVAVFAQAAELAPVLGLAGTLLSLGGLSALAAAGDTAGAIGTAVTTTLYGLVLANFLFAPLAAAIARRSGKEEQKRQELLDWLEDAVRDALHAAPPAAPSTSAARSRAA
jgi:chemotaxis protein MotA